MQPVRSRYRALSRNKRQRGTTIAELLSVVAVLGLIMSAVAFVIGPLLRSQSHTQAKVDTVQAAAMALYRIERDLRNSSVDQIFVCTTTGTPTCSTPSLTTATAQAVVISSAFANGGGPFQLQANGLPKWQGATVYWVDAVGNLNVAFDANPGTFIAGNALTAAQAQAAVTDVTTNGGMQLARFVETLALGAPATVHEVTLQLQARSTVNSANNETIYTTDVETRNRSS